MAGVIHRYEALQILGHDPPLFNIGVNIDILCRYIVFEIIRKWNLMQLCSRTAELWNRRTICSIWNSANEIDLLTSNYTYGFTWSSVPCHHFCVTPVPPSLPGLEGSSKPLRMDSNLPQGMTGFRKCQLPQNMQLLTSKENQKYPHSSCSSEDSQLWL